jgi:hypothetical protein
VNHPDQSLPFIEIEVYHFSAAQAVVSGSSTTTDYRHNQSSGSGAAVYAECFIDSAAVESAPLYWVLVLLIISAVTGVMKTTHRILLNYTHLPFLSQSPQRSQSFFDFSLRTRRAR